MQLTRTYPIGASTLTLTFGDITSSNAEVLVSSDDSQLTMGGGVSAAIRRAAGQSLLLEVAKRVPAKIGDIVVTSAGSLPAKHIFHAITISRGQATVIDIVTRSTRRAIELLLALDLSSIAFPAIGAGVAGLPYEDVAVSMACVLVDELARATKSVAVAIYLYDRFGQMQPMDYVRFFEEFASRTRGLNGDQALSARQANAKLPKPRDRRTAPVTARSGALAELMDLDKERQTLESRLALYSGALPRQEVRKGMLRLKDIQEARVRLLSTVSPKPSKAVSVFVSYSHVDELLRKELGKHLAVLERQGIITTWHDRMILAGAEWDGVIDRRLNLARVILLLISVDFLDSKYCNDVEMARALERHQEKTALVIPIILRSVSLKGTPFARLQALPQDAKPVVTWPDRDSAFAAITDGLRNTIQDLVGAA